MMDDRTSSSSSTDRPKAKRTVFGLSNLFDDDESEQENDPVQKGQQRLPFRKSPEVEEVASDDESDEDDDDDDDDGQDSELSGDDDDAGKMLLEKYTSNAETASKTFGFVDATGMMMGQPSFWRIARHYESSCDEIDDDDERRRRRKRRRGGATGGSSWLHRYEHGQWRCLGCAYISSGARGTSASSGKARLSVMETCLEVIEKNYQRMDPLQLSNAVHRVYMHNVPNAGKPGYPPIWRTLDILAHIQNCVLEPSMWIANAVRRLRQLQATLSEMIFEKTTEVPSDAARKLLTEIQRLQREGGGGEDDEGEADEEGGPLRPRRRRGRGRPRKSPAPAPAPSSSSSSSLPTWMMEAAAPREKLKVNRDVLGFYMAIHKEITRLLSLDPKKLLFHQTEWKINIESTNSLLNVAGSVISQ